MDVCEIQRITADQWFEISTMSYLSPKHKKFAYGFGRHKRAGKNLSEAQIPVAIDIWAIYIKNSGNKTPDQRTCDGFCIRCGSPIPFNYFKPLCSNCYHGHQGGRNDPEKYCHFGGERWPDACKSEWPITVNKPICSEDYKILKLKGLI